VSLLPEVREALMATAARRVSAAGGGGSRWRPRLHRGGVAVALGTGVALAVFAVAVLGLRHRTPGPAGSGGSTGSGVAALEAKLAVLRRPRTAAERAYARKFRPGSPVIAKLTRLATTVGTPNGPVRVYLLVVRMPRTAAPFLAAAAVDRQGETQGGTPQVTASTLSPSAVGAGARIRGVGRDPNRGVTVSIVPDGVTRVKWEFTGAGFGILKPHPVTVYPEVKNNVATAPVEPGQGPLARAVWYGAGGRVIALAAGGQDAKQELKQIQAVNASRGRTIAPELIAHYRLFRSVAPVDLARNPVLPTAAGGPGDLNYWQTRYIASVTGLDGRGLWITPGTHDVCISDWNAGYCAAPLSPRDDAGILGGSTSNGRETTIVGLVADGNATVTVALAGGARKTFPVIDNVYEITVRGRTVAVIDRDTHGKVVRTSLGG
jgi:hypothetical protein